MQTYEVAVIGRSVVQNGGDSTLVRTSAGVDQLHVLFDNPEWAAFPVACTFTNGSESVAVSLTVAEIESDGYGAESTCLVPWEVLQEVGDIELCFHGASSGDYIITESSGALLHVVQEGAVGDGTVPSQAPTQSEWEQAYSDAMATVNQAATLVSGLQEQLDAIVSEANDSMEAIASLLPVATEESLGVVSIGEGITVDDYGMISADGAGGLTTEQALAIENAARLIERAFDGVFSERLLQSATVAVGALPIATSSGRGVVKVDNSSIEVDNAGTISVKDSYITEQLQYTARYIGGMASFPNSGIRGAIYVVGGEVKLYDGSIWIPLSLPSSISASSITGTVSEDNLPMDYWDETELVEMTAAQVHSVTGYSSIAAPSAEEVGY